MLKSHFNGIGCQGMIRSTMRFSSIYLRARTLPNAFFAPASPCTRRICPPFAHAGHERDRACLIGMSRIALDRMDTGTNVITLAIKLHVASQRTVSLNGSASVSLP